MVSIIQVSYKVRFHILFCDEAEMKLFLAVYKENQYEQDELKQNDQI